MTTAHQDLADKVRAALAPTPGRWSEAALVAGAATTAMAIAIVCRVPNFAAPTLAFISLQHTTVCTWRNLIRRLAILLAFSMAAVPIAGFLVQTPWLMVPCFFLIVVALTYGVPAARSPIESILISFPLITAFFNGTYDPAALPVATRDVAAACAIGVTTATVFAHLSSRGSARARLAGSLAASFARSESILREALARDASRPPPGGFAEAPVHSDLAEHVQLLDLVRQEGIAAATDRTLITLTTAAERIATFVGTIDTQSRQSVPRTYRTAMAAEIDQLAEGVLVGLRAFADAAHRLATRDDVAIGDDGAWPDLAARVATVRARQIELRRSPQLASIAVAESTNMNAIVQSLAGLADVLHTPPWELRALAAADELAPPPVWPYDVLPIDRFALRYALQVGLGATLALVIGIAAHEPELSTLLWNPILVAQMSYGATIRKAWLRLGGVVLGGVLGLLTMIVVFPNSNDVLAWLSPLFVVVAGSHYAILGMPFNWYGAFQVSVTYFAVLVGLAPATDVGPALWRAFGTFGGTAILFVVFRLVAPDYAGRQLVARFADLLRLARRYLPEPGETPAPRDELVQMRIATARASADVLRLVEEARLEGRASGIDASAGIEATGLALRSVLRAGLIARDRAVIARPPLGERAQAALDALRHALRARLDFALALLDARHTMADPDTGPHREACRAARALAARPRTELEPLLAALVDAAAEARFAELLQWPPEASGAFLAEVDHLRRMTQLLTRLDAAVERMLLPGDVAQEAVDVAPARATPAGVTRTPA